jgi:hypothetical protein
MKETIDALWYTIIGTNGEGMIAKVDRIEQEFDKHQKKETPKRLEKLAVWIGILVAAQTLGLTDLIRELVARWLSGGA